MPFVLFMSSIFELPYPVYSQTIQHEQGDGGSKVPCTILKRKKLILGRRNYEAFFTPKSLPGRSSAVVVKTGSEKQCHEPFWIFQCHVPLLFFIFRTKPALLFYVYSCCQSPEAPVRIRPSLVLLHLSTQRSLMLMLYN